MLANWRIGMCLRLPLRLWLEWSYMNYCTFVDKSEKEEKILNKKVHMCKNMASCLIFVSFFFSHFSSVYLGCNSGSLIRGAYHSSCHWHFRSLRLSHFFSFFFYSVFFFFFLGSSHSLRVFLCLYPPPTHVSPPPSFPDWDITIWELKLRVWF